MTLEKASVIQKDIWVKCCHLLFRLRLIRYLNYFVNYQDIIEKAKVEAARRLDSENLGLLSMRDRSKFIFKTRKTKLLGNNR